MSLSEKNTALAYSSSVKFKGTLLSLTVLQIYDNDLSLIKKDIEKTINQAPKLFERAPIVLDLAVLNEQNLSIDIHAIQDLLNNFQLILVALIHSNSKQAEQAKKLNIALLSSFAPSKNIEENDAISVEEKNYDNKIVEQLVRSGQQIYAKNSNLIVLGNVSHGAELIADGNIHIYGTLMGRALAGAQGDTNARIFCAKMEAELVSIAGVYQLREQFLADKEPSAKQVFLEEERLVIADLY